MKVTITINGEKLDLTEVDFTATPDEIMEELVDLLGVEVDPEFNGRYMAVRQAH